MKKPKFGVRPFSFISQAAPDKTQPSKNVYDRIAVCAEKLGYDTITMFDHLMSMGDMKLAMSLGMYDHLLLAKDSVLEHWVTMAHFATLTKRINIASNVTCINFRHPSIVAKAAATLDVISDGRFELGLGTGGDMNEAKAYGLGEPGSPKVRAEKLDEYVEIIKKMWSEETTTFVGKHFAVNQALCVPKPIQNPHPPINIAGRYAPTLRVIAKHANIYTHLDLGGPRDNLRPIVQRNDALKLQCERIGRNYDDIEKAVLFRLLLAESESALDREMKKWLPPAVPREHYEKAILCCTPKECLSVIGEYLDADINYFFLDFMDASTTNGMQLFAEEVLKNV